MTSNAQPQTIYAAANRRLDHVQGWRISARLHMSQLCADGSRSTVQSKERCGLDKVVAARVSTWLSVVPGPELGAAVGGDVCGWAIRNGTSCAGFATGCPVRVRTHTTTKHTNPRTANSCRQVALLALGNHRQQGTVLVGEALGKALRRGKPRLGVTGLDLMRGVKASHPPCSEILEHGRRRLPISAASMAARLSNLPGRAGGTH